MMFGIAFLFLSADCTFRIDPEGHLQRANRTFAQASAQLQFAKTKTSLASIDPLVIRNVIDSEIFQRLEKEGVPATAPSSDLEFVRRIYLDLTGRIPSPQQVRDFTSSTSPGKRDQLIDSLIGSPEFSDKWTMWVGDWLQNNTKGIYSGTQTTRNQFYRWIRENVRSNRSLREVASDVLTADRDSVRKQTGGFLASNEVNTGPKEDSWDNMTAKTATVFLGMSHYDCVLCHNGQRRLDVVSVWGSRTARIEALRVAALFTHSFSYPGVNGQPAAMQHFPVDGYSMRTVFGNRPNRAPAPEGELLQPAYRDGSRPPSDPTQWRKFLAVKVTEDPMFARNLANRLWKQMFGLALAEPLDALDPERLDPANRPPAPWILQASHPELLEKLAQNLRDTDFDLRAFVRLMAQSSAYQLSSSWTAARPWQNVYLPLVARHLPRRLDAEEVHDAVVAATGLPNTYSIPGLEEPIRWAMQAPDTAEPIADRFTRDFLDAFYRGNRDGNPRQGTSSMLQSFKLLNDHLVLSRMNASLSPILKRIAAFESVEDQVDELFLAFLSRPPSAAERQQCQQHFANAETPQKAVEDLAWVLVNRPDFVFAY
jgi:hypothetical protein